MIIQTFNSGDFYDIKGYKERLEFIGPVNKVLVEEVFTRLEGGRYSSTYLLFWEPEHSRFVIACPSFERVAVGKTVEIQMKLLVQDKLNDLHKVISIETTRYEVP